MERKRIKKIEYYNLNGKVDASKAAEIFIAGIGLNKVEEFDDLGNLTRENGFDRAMQEDNVVEYKYEESGRLIEKITYKNYHNQPMTPNYLNKYIYRHGLLKEVLWYFRTFDSSGYFAKNEISYNEKGQKIKDVFTELENGVKEVRTYVWKDTYSYIESRTDKDGELVERHFVKLGDKGNEVEHHMNFEPSTKDDSTFPMAYKYAFDSYGNEIARMKDILGKEAEKTKYEYLYENTHWNYRVFYKDEQPLWTQFRRIVY